MNQKLIIYWSRRDLRTHDNSALFESVNKSLVEKAPFLPIFFVEPYMVNADPKYQFGYPSRYFLSKALPEFALNFKDFLILNEKPTHFFKELSKKYDIEIFVNEDIYPDFYKQVQKLNKQNIKITITKDQLTVDKNTVTGAGAIYSVFTPFKKAVLKSFVNEDEVPAPNLEKVSYFDLKNIKTKRLDHTDSSKILKFFSSEENILIGKNIINIGELNLPKRDLENWYFSENEALKIFKNFVKNKISNYGEARNMLADDGTSKMSLALAWGLVSSRMLVKIIQKHFDNSFENVDVGQKGLEGGAVYISEFIWREFYKYLLYHKPELVTEPFQQKFKNVKWLSGKEAEKRFILWMTGKTGYKIVDSAMNELAKTGWMHNRTRMVVSSILTKNLGIDWRFGQEYFRAMLIDLDESSNIGGWQWGASVGADPKPIRIFNPYLQAEKFDPDSVYQNKWLPADYLQNTPEPVVEHSLARNEAIARYKV